FKSSTVIAPPDNLAPLNDFSCFTVDNNSILLSLDKAINGSCNGLSLLSVATSSKSLFDSSGCSTLKLEFSGTHLLSF
ncbi:hypothetical protein, partial [Intestinibacter sp.]|uniref:hypothetical protein n=1 Tax=Intestinibacter sp. TaxID=1965304 RepID=UPI002A761126